MRKTLRSPIKQTRPCQGFQSLNFAFCSFGSVKACIYAANGDRYPNFFSGLVLENIVVDYYFW